MVTFLGQMSLNTLVSLRIILFMDSAPILGKVIVNIKGHGLTIKCMVMVFLPGLTDENIMANM